MVGGMKWSELKDLGELLDRAPSVTKRIQGVTAG
jgi:hypothetical protein